MKLRFLLPFTVLSLLILNIGHAQFAEYHISNFRLNPVRFAPELAGADGCKTMNSSIYTRSNLFDQRTTAASIGAQGFLKPLHSGIYVNYDLLKSNRNANTLNAGISPRFEIKENLHILSNLSFGLRNATISAAYTNEFGQNTYALEELTGLSWGIGAGFVRENFFATTHHSFDGMYKKVSDGNIGTIVTSSTAIGNTNKLTNDFSLAWTIRNTIYWNLRTSRIYDFAAVAQYKTLSAQLGYSTSTKFSGALALEIAERVKIMGGLSVNPFETFDKKLGYSFLSVNVLIARSNPNYKIYDFILLF